MAMIMTIIMMMIKGLTGEKEAVVRCERRLGGSDVKARLIKEAAHKRNQIGLLCFSFSPPRVMSGLPRPFTCSGNGVTTPNLEQYQTTPENSLVTYCLIHNNHSNSYILSGSNISGGGSDATRLFWPDFDNVFRNIERWECAVLFPWFQCVEQGGRCSDYCQRLICGGHRLTWRFYDTHLSIVFSADAEYEIYLKFGEVFRCRWNCARIVETSGTSACSTPLEEQREKSWLLPQMPCEEQSKKRSF